MYLDDLENHIKSTLDSDNKQGKYMLGNGLETKDILFSIPIPERCKTLGDAYFLASVLRRMVSYIKDGDRGEALKIGHEISILYDKEERG